MNKIQIPTSSTPIDLDEEVLGSKITNVHRDGDNMVFGTWRGEFSISPFDEAMFNKFLEYEKSGEIIKLKFS